MNRLFPLLIAILVLSSALAGCVLSMPGQPSLPQQPQPNRDAADGRKIYWTGFTDGNEMKWRNAPDWASEITFRDVPVRTDFVFLYEQEFMEEIRQKGLGHTRRPEFDAEYAATLQTAIDKHVPDIGFRGVICFDIESLPFVWGDRTNGPGISPKTDQGPHHADLWATWTRDTEPGLLNGRTTEEQERVLKRTYEGTARLWITKTFDEVRRLRPRAKLAMYGLPAGSRYVQYTYAEPNRWKKINDDARWLIDLQDVTVLVLYQNRKVRPRGEKAVFPILTYEEGVAYITDNVAEARRVAPEKPLLALIAFWHPDGKGEFDSWLNGPAMEVSIAETARAGADKLIIWNYFNKAGQSTEFQRVLDERALGLLREHWTR